jgi:hypothetical protein
MYTKNKEYGVSDAVAKEGDDLMAALFDASVQTSMGGVGGCKDFDLNEFPIRWHKLISAYINHEICAVTACYIAMKQLDKNEVYYDC